jgi:hypothetical protein
MSETSTVPAPLDDPAYALALDAGHTAAAAGHWLAAATRFGDALRAAAPAGAGLPPLGPVEAAVALTNLGQALARAGCWPDAAEMLRRSAEARDALVTDGLADEAVAARGWSDLAALLAAAGPEGDARAAITRAHAAAPTIDDPAVLAALAETRLLLGHGPAAGTPEPPAATLGAPTHDDALGFELPFAAPAARMAAPAECTVTIDALDLDETFDVAPPRSAEPAAPSTVNALELDLAPTDVERPAHVPAPAIAADAGSDDAPDLAALLALAAAPPEPDLEPVELDGDDSLSAALDAAVLSLPDMPRDTPAAAAGGPSAASTAALAGLQLMPMDEDEAPFPASVPAPRSERAASAMVSQIVFDELDADPSDTEPVVLTPGVDLSAPRGSRPAAPGGARGARLAAVDAVVQLSAAAAPPAQAGGLRGRLRRLLGR